MKEWDVRMRGVAEGNVVVQAETKEEAEAEAKARGLELADLVEVLDAEVIEVSEF